MSSFSTAWWSHKQDTGWATRSLGAVKFQDPHNFLQNNTLRAVTIEFNDLSLAGFLDSLNLKSEFSKGVFRELLDIIFLELNDLIFALEVTLNLIDAYVLCNIEQDKFVWHDTHLL